MSTRLNRDMVADIVKSALAATTLPVERKAIFDETGKRARALWVGSLPLDLVQLTQEHPASFFRWSSSEYVGGRDFGNWMPTEIIKSAEDETGKRHPGTHVKFNDPVVTLDGHDFKFEASQFADLTLRAKKWALARENARTVLRGYLLSCNTVEAALKGMPELAPHIPERVAKTTYAVVAPSNALSALTKLGFDTTVKS